MQLDLVVCIYCYSLSVTCCRLMKGVCAGFILVTLDNFIPTDVLKLLIGRRILSNFNMESISPLERCIQDFTLYFLIEYASEKKFCLVLIGLVAAFLQVEAALLSCNYVDNIMVYADPFHNYCVALVVPSHQVLEKWAQQASINYRDFSELCDKAETVSEVQQSLSKVCVFVYLLMTYLKLC
jgi:hypothetical protein